MKRIARRGIIGLLTIVMIGLSVGAASEGRFEGKFFAGEGDAEYLQLLDAARRMFDADPEFQNMAMLYTPAWNGLVEGPTWGAWWIQNSYGTTYCALPFYTEPFVRFLQNAQDLWFDQMGDGKRAGANNWVAPDGCLCDAASPGWIVYKQGDGRTDIHDWGMEFTAAGLLMQSELLLISRDAEAIAHYLPRLERCAQFIESRRDPKNNLFLAGPAGNLLAPSYAGCRLPDGSYGQAYLTGLSVTYIAALDRLIELEKLAGNADAAKQWATQRDLARQGLSQLATEEGYFIKSMDPDGTRHGVYGAEKHGYFEASPNHDAIAFRVVDDEQAGRIYQKIASIPLLRRNTFILANEPGLDDMYDPGTSWLWQHGTWVNGGHWSTCEGRMVMAYYRLGQYEDARRSMQTLLTFARDFRMDNPLVDFGAKVYQPKEPINLCYDTFAPAAAMVRGLFEYQYKANELVLCPHIPPSLTALEQRFPIRYGTKKLYLATYGTGPIQAVRINGQPWSQYDEKTVTLPYGATPDRAQIQIVLGNGVAPETMPAASQPETLPASSDAAYWDVTRVFPSGALNALPFRIGADSNGGSRFIGDIGRVQVFDKPLADEQITALAKTDEAADASPIADWRFERIGNGAFANAAGGGLGATITGPADGAQCVDAAEIPGKKAVRLDGKAFLDVPYSPKLDLNEAFTLTAWIKLAAYQASGSRILDKIPAGVNAGYLLDLDPGKQLRVITPRGSLTFDAKIPENRWTHVAAAYAADGEIRLFVNGQRVASLAAEKTAASDTPRRIAAFYQALERAGLTDAYEGRHARLILDYVAAIHARKALIEKGAVAPLPEASMAAANKSYMDTITKLCQGLSDVLAKPAPAAYPRDPRVSALWAEAMK